MVAVGETARVVDEMPDAHLVRPGSQAADHRAHRGVGVEGPVVDQRSCACRNELLGDRSDVEDGVRAEGLSGVGVGDAGYLDVRDDTCSDDRRDVAPARRAPAPPVTTGQPFCALRLRSVRRSASSRSRSTSSKEMWLNAAASDGCTASISRCIACATAPVRGVPGGLGPQLRQVHRLARRHLHHEPDPVGHRHRVLRDIGQTRGRDRLGGLARAVHHAAPVGLEPGFHDRVRHVVAERRGQALPLEGERAVALEVAVGAVVADDVEPVLRALPGAAGLVPAVPALADARREDRGAICLGSSSARPRAAGRREGRSRRRAPPPSP